MPEDNKNFFQPIDYLWGDRDYNKSFIGLQSTIFQVVCRSQALLKKIEQYDFSQSSKYIIQKKDSLYNQTISCLKKIVDTSFDLSELLKQLDSYVTVFRDLQMENMQELISSMQARAGQNALAALRNEAVPYVPETFTSGSELSLASPEQAISSEPVITSTTTISEDNVKSFGESNPVVSIDGNPPQDNNSEPQIIENILDPAISSVEGLASSGSTEDGIKENDNPTVSTGSNGFQAQSKEPVMEYVEGLVTDGASEEIDKSPENENPTVSPGSNDSKAQAEDPVIPYVEVSVTDGASDENNKSPENENPAVSTGSNDSKAQNEDPVMEYVEGLVPSGSKEDGGIKENDNPAVSTERNGFQAQTDEPVMESADSNPIIFDDTTAVSGETDDSISNIFVETAKKNDSKVIPFPSQLIASEQSNVTANDDINDAKLLNIPLSPTIPNGSNSDIIVDDVQNNDEPTTTFERTGSDDVRAILVTPTQGYKLRESRPGQEALFRKLTNASDADNVDFSIEKLLALDDESFNERLESMVDKASNLYNSGNLDDAQAMFNKVEEINRQRRERRSEKPDDDDAFVYKKVA